MVSDIIIADVNNTLHASQAVSYLSSRILIGLYYLGNSCYLNKILQIFLTHGWQMLLTDKSQCVGSEELLAFLYCVKFHPLYIEE